MCVGVRLEIMRYLETLPAMEADSADERVCYTICCSCPVRESSLSVRESSESPRLKFVRAPHADGKFDVVAATGLMRSAVWG